MTSYPQPPAGYDQQADVVSPELSRPGTLKAAAGAAIVAAVLAVVDAVLLISGARGLANNLAGQVLADELGMTLDQARNFAGDELLNAAIDEAVGTVDSRGYLLIGIGVALVLFGLLMLVRAAAWTRVLLAVAALAATTNSIRIATDDGTTGMIVFAWATAVVAVVTLVLAWLPANRRYAKARKGK